MERIKRGIKILRADLAYWREFLYKWIDNHSCIYDNII